MALITKVKASLVNNLSDARYFSAAGVDWLGFCLDPEHPAFVVPEIVKEIAEWLHGIEVIGEFGNQTPDIIADTATQLQLEKMQIPVGLAADERFREFKIFGVVDLEDSTTERQFDEVEYLVLKATGKNWNQLSAYKKGLIREISESHQVLLDIPCAPSDYENILKSYPIAGVNIYGGNETEPGIGSFDDLDAVFEVLDPEF